MDEMKTYICRKATDVHDKWRDAQEVQLTQNREGHPPLFATSGRLAYDQSYLHVLFSCEDDLFHAAMTQFNDKIYQEDVVEIFVDDDCDRKAYIEIEVSPINTLLHYLIQNDQKGRFIGFARTENHIISQVRVDRSDPSHLRWQAELSIPYSELMTAPGIPPQPGDVWLFNLFRIKRKPDGFVEELSFSNTKRESFHCPDSFARLLFE